MSCTSECWWKRVREQTKSKRKMKREGCKGRDRCSKHQTRRRRGSVLGWTGAVRARATSDLLVPADHPKHPNTDKQSGTEATSATDRYRYREKTLPGRVRASPSCVTFVLTAPRYLSNGGVRTRFLFTNLGCIAGNH